MGKRRVISLAGLSGSALILIGSLVTVMFYTGTHGERYSILNHYISELGQMGVSQLAPLFNICLIVGCLLMTVFMVTLGRYIGGKFGYIFSAVGLVAGVSGALVGVFPMNNMHIHVPVALTFFRTAMISSVMFSGYVLFTRNNKFHRAVSIPGVLTAIASFAFVFISKSIHQAAKPLEVPATTRPEVWLDPLLEWSVFITIILWVFTVSLYLKGGGSVTDNPTDIVDLNRNIF